jgi:hypothetical protein
MSNKRTKTPRSSFKKVKAHKKSTSLIERVWAEDGMVFSITTEGQTKLQSVKEAATACMKINEHMVYLQELINDPLKDNQSLRQELAKGNTFIELVTKVCREAMVQKAAGNNKTDLLQNFVNHKDADGNDNTLVDEDQRIEFLLSQFNTLDEQDIRAVVRNLSLTPDQQDSVISRMHTQNMATKQNFKKSDVII